MNISKRINCIFQLYNNISCVKVDILSYSWILSDNGYIVVSKITLIDYPLCWYVCNPKVKLKIVV